MRWQTAMLLTLLGLLTLGRVAPVRRSAAEEQTASGITPAPRGATETRDAGDGREAKAREKVLLEVVNEAGKKFALSLAEIGQFPQKEVTAKDHRGTEAKFSGVPLHEVLKKAEVVLGPQLRGKLLVNCLLVEAADDYRVAFSLPEVDPDWTDDVVLLATARDGQALDKDHGPFQLVVPGEKRHSRWVKRVTRLSIHKLAP